ncbi:MAG: pseudouridine synthase [Oliverpabstia sp.]|nr:rRNA pseudouridine synthase [Lachnospiraceae bacterium]MDY5027399.1 pseudouridine synthase [Oliverpabstia sp.]
MGELLRLDKYLADAGVGTRSQVKQMIRKGQIAINGEPVKKPDQKVDGEKDKIEVMGKEIRYQKYRYLLLHKPSGYVSATEDKKEQTVLSLLPEKLRKDLFPVGRLDKDTEGLLLLTNDGALAHRLLSPKKHVNKTYYARVQGRVTDEDQAAFLQGVDIGDEKDTLPAQLEILEAAEESRILLTIQEGRFHQVKRMFEARGKKVVYLKRISMGPLALEEGLKPGDYRELTEEEQEALGLKEK